MLIVHIFLINYRVISFEGKLEYFDENLIENLFVIGFVGNESGEYCGRDFKYLIFIDF